MAVVHREDGGAAGMSGRGGAEGKESTLVGACREGKGREEEGVEREAGDAPNAGGSSSGRWLSECRWKHQAPGKRPSGRFHFFSGENVNK